MTTVVNANIEDLVAAIEDVQRTSADVKGFTSSEVIAATGLSDSTVQKWLRRLCIVGRVRHVGSRLGTRIDGRPCRLPAYALVKPTKRRK